MAMIAAMKNVLSPNSDTMMTEIEATKAWIKPKFPLLDSSSENTGFTGWGGDAFCKDLKKNKQPAKLFRKSQTGRFAMKTRFVFTY